MVLFTCHWCGSQSGHTRMAQSQSGGTGTGPIRHYWHCMLSSLAEIFIIFGFGNSRSLQASWIFCRVLSDHKMATLICNSTPWISISIYFNLVGSSLGAALSAPIITRTMFTLALHNIFMSVFWFWNFSILLAFLISTLLLYRTVKSMVLQFCYFLSATFISSLLASVLLLVSMALSHKIS